MRQDWCSHDAPQDLGIYVVRRGRRFGNSGQFKRFLVAALFAYALTPLVDRLDRRRGGRLPRVLAERVPGPARILCSVRAERGLEFRYGWEVPERLTLLPWEVREPPFEGVTHVLYVPGRPTDPTPAVRALLDAGEVVHEQSGVRLVRMPPR